MAGKEPCTHSSVPCRGRWNTSACAVRWSNHSWRCFKEVLEELLAPVVFLSSGSCCFALATIFVLVHVRTCSYRWCWFYRCYTTPALLAQAWAPFQWASMSVRSRSWALCTRVTTSRCGYKLLVIVTTSVSFQLKNHMSYKNLAANTTIRNAVFNIDNPSGLVWPVWNMF